MLLLLNICAKNKIVANCKIRFNWTKTQLWVTGPPRKT